jgi:hypothetical protein
MRLPSCDPSIWVAVVGWVVIFVLMGSILAVLLEVF